MIREGDAPVWPPLGDIAVGVVVVANLRAATKARDVLQRLPVIDGVAVDILDFRARLLGDGRLPAKQGPVPDHESQRPETSLTGRLQPLAAREGAFPWLW